MRATRLFASLAAAAFLAGCSARSQGAAPPDAPPAAVVPPPRPVVAVPTAPPVAATPAVAVAPAPEAARLPPPRAGQVTLAMSPIGPGRARFGLQLRGDAKAWKGLKVFGADAKEIASLACDAGNAGPAYSEFADTARLGDPVRLELWSAAASGQRGIVETRDLPRSQCDGAVTYVIWEFD